jgi:hypothetical protein
MGRKTHIVFPNTGIAFAFTGIPHPWQIETANSEAIEDCESEIE